MKSKTQRTDECLIPMPYKNKEGGIYVVPASLSYELETELNEARADFECMKDQRNHLFEAIDRKNALIKQMLEALVIACNRCKCSGPCGEITEYCQDCEVIDARRKARNEIGEDGE